ncbi:dynamin-related protein 3A-like [Carica papaya]|uniref:dynamin-related protein 3A-like n=1 Tax=Carica papaya TaxID=3649 RepID=UPI000B8C9FAE|nr:dynamin-related protein 3A-like [Carica papaya]
MQDVSKNWNIQEAFATEESFFIEHPVYSKLANHCGIPQLAKKLNQILELHIRNVHPGLKAKLNYHMVTLAGELQAYRKVIDSKEEQREVLLNILDRYCQDFCAMIDGSNQNMSTRQLYDSRIHYVFESIFGTTLEELDPCENLADENIQKTIRNVTGIKPASLLFTVLFEVLARK